ncbi:hypothetical protein GFK90_07645 [Roseibium aggregatum]|nr:hypothetical protein GFK90_07645 [Roseibium aggregatum]
MAKSGFQHGGDAGPAGRQGRRFRIETKRYAEKTSLSDRELLGEIDHALIRDPALEAWFLAATRDAPEQLEQDLLGKSDQLGLPIVVIDWKPGSFPTLAALCTAAPEVVHDMAGKEAGDLARALTSNGASRLAQLRRELETWNLGFERLRDLSHRLLSEVWINRRASVATLGQDVAGGAAKTTITRVALHNDFDGWWSGRGTEDAPAVILGNEGVGKTWATVQWLIDRSELQPIVVVIPSGAAAGLIDTSLASVKRFIGDRLYEITESRDQSHWRLRLDRLLRRPKEEGPVLTLVFDGLNQEPSVRWIDLLKTLQHSAIEGRVRVIAITRNLHFTERLKHLQGLVIAPRKVKVGPYDDSPDGELDQRLALEGLTRDDLHPDLIEIARTPRLFSLVVRLRDQLMDGGQVTVHRLLWEYGRDTLGVRDRSLSEQEWRTWLADVARNQREGIRDYNLGSIGSMVGRADLDQNDVFRRLSDIVDGRFAAGGAGKLTLSPTIVSHALGAALLEHLRGVQAETGLGALEAALTNWLDPIAAIDERAEILRAAVSILLESDPAGQKAVLDLLVKGWLRSQNLPETHRGEIVRLGVALCEPLLDIVEQNSGPARNLAVDALRRMPRDHEGSRNLVLTRCGAWLKVVSRDVERPGDRNNDADKARSDRLIKRIGVDVDGERVVLGERLTFVKRLDHNAQHAIPTLLDGYPLIPALPVFSAAAFAMAIRGREGYWSGLKWLCLLNEIDPKETTAALRAHSDAVRIRAPEDGVHPELAGRIGALLLWLSGDEDMEALAVVTDPGLDRRPDFRADYLADPGRSIFSLQRRHADPVMRDKTIPLSRRINKVSGFLTDPAFELPDEFVAEVCAASADFDVSVLDSHLGWSVEDRVWEEFETVLARGAPDLLATLVRRKLDGLATRKGGKQRIGLSRSTADFLLADRIPPEALATLSALPAEKENGNEIEREFERSRALMIDAALRPPAERVTFLLGQDTALYTDLSEVLSPLESVEVDALVERYRGGGKAADLVRILSLIDATPGDGSWDWFVEKALEPGFDASGTACRLLWTADRARFGRDLLSRDWSWGKDRGDWDNHYGSLALVEASAGLPFEHILVRIAPWLIPHAVLLRGGDPVDSELAAQFLDGVLSLDGRSAPDLGSDVIISEAVRAEDPEAFTLSIRDEEHISPIANQKEAFNDTRRSEARSRAIPTALERMREAREDGASLFMHDFVSRDLEPIVRYALSAVVRWLDGVDGPSLDFERRVLLAEGFYIALCEALLVVRPAEGARLWRALRAALRTRFIGAAGVDQLTLMLHRVPTTPDTLRREQLNLPQTHTDEGLFEVALASRLSGDTTWLEAFIREDEASAETWRRQRGRMLHGFLVTGHALNNNDALDEWGSSLREDREQRAERWRRREVFARHWWDRYWSVDTDEEAYAAWVLLLRIVDRRAHAWMELPKGMQERHPRRVAHYRLNHDDLVRAMKKAEKKLDREFLGRPIFDGVHPWLKRPD